MATKITSGSIFSAGAVIVGVDADAPPATPSAPDTISSLHINGTASGIVDISPNSYSVNSYGDVSVVDVSPYSTGKSMTFDGSGDYLNVPSEMNFGTEDFTFEGWYYLTGDRATFLSGSQNGSYDFVYVSNSIRIGRVNTAWDQIINHTLTQNTWQHISFVRSSGTLSVYVDGNLIGAETNNNNYFSGSTVWIGQNFIGGSDARGFSGSMSDVRIVTGEAVYTENFSTPTSPLGDYSESTPAPESDPDPASISLTYYAVASDASDDNAMNEGSVFIYNANDGSFVTQLDVSSVDPTRVQDRLGYELESYGSKLFIRAYGDDESAYNVGAVFVYDTNDLTSDPIKLFPSSPISGRSNFGESIVSTDDKLFIGESGQMFATESGRVHVYDLSDLSADPTVLSAGVSGDGFGKSLTVSSGKLFVGAHTDNVGKVYVYDLSDLVASPAIISGQGNQFGFELTSNSNTIFVHGRDNSQAGAIRAYDATDLSFLNAWFGADGSDYLGWDMSADENYLYTGSPQMNKVNVYDLSNYSASPIELTASGSSGFGYSINVKETALIVGSNEAAYVYDTTDLNASPLVLTNDDGATGENFGIYTALL